MLRSMRKYIRVILIIVILFFVASCFAGYGLYVRGGNKGGGGRQDYPVAEINGKTVMRSDLEKSAATISEQAGQNVTSADVPRIRQAALDSMVIQSELEKEIENRKIDVANDEINAEYTKLMDSYPTREEFMEYMKRQNITEKQIKDDIKKKLEMQKVLASVENEIKVDDKEVHAFYDTAKNFLYKQPAGVMVNLASFKSKTSAEAVQKAVAGGAKWDAEIAKYKGDVIMATSYDKPMLMTDQMFQKELAPLKTYPMNKLMPVQDAGQNLSFIAIKRSTSPERVLSFNEVSADVKNSIKQQKLQEAQQKFYDTLLSRADTKILDATIFPAKTAPASADKTASEDKKN